MTDLQLIDKGAELPDRCCPVPLRRSGWWRLSRRCEAPRIGYLMLCWPSRSLIDRILCGVAWFYQGVLIQRQGYHGDYACSFGIIAMSGGDGMDSSTQLPAVRRVWVLVVT
jgi:hypothetical protein